MIFHWRYLDSCVWFILYTYISYRGTKICLIHILLTGACIISHFYLIPIFCETKHKPTQTTNGRASTEYTIANHTILTQKSFCHIFGSPWDTYLYIHIFILCHGLTKSKSVLIWPINWFLNCKANLRIHIDFTQDLWFKKICFDDVHYIAITYERRQISKISCRQ